MNLFNPQAGATQVSRIRGAGIKRIFLKLALGLISIGAPQAVAQSSAPPAQDDTPEAIGEPSDEWRNYSGFQSALTLLVPDTTQALVGVGPQIEPDYFGSDNYRVDEDPQAYIRIRDFTFFDDDGAEFAVLGFKRFRLGPTLRVQGKREPDDNPALIGLDRIGKTFEFGGFGATSFRDRYTIKIKYRHAIKTGHRGGIVDAQGSMLLFQRGPVSTSLGATGTWIGNNYADAFFDISEAEAARSGLPRYAVGSGFRDVSGIFNAFVRVGSKWALNPYFQYHYILPDYAASPIVQDFGSRHQYVAGVHLMREFRFFNNRRRQRQIENFRERSRSPDWEY